MQDFFVKCSGLNLRKLRENVLISVMIIEVNTAKEKAFSVRKWLRTFTVSKQKTSCSFPSASNPMRRCLTMLLS